MALYPAVIGQAGGNLVIVGHTSDNDLPLYGLVTEHSGDAYRWYWGYINETRRWEPCERHITEHLRRAIPIQASFQIHSNVSPTRTVEWSAPVPTTWPENRPYGVFREHPYSCGGINWRGHDIPCACAFTTIPDNLQIPAAVYDPDGFVYETTARKVTLTESPGYSSTRVVFASIKLTAEPCSYINDLVCVVPAGREAVP